MAGTEKVRVLMLLGEQGVVGCRLNPPMSYTMPRLSEGVLTGVAASHTRIRNLVAVRGREPGTRMIGPLNYLYNVKDPANFEFMLDIGEEGVVLKQRERSFMDVEQFRKPSGVHYCAKWRSRVEGAGGDSLFPNKGVLEFSEDRIEVPVFIPPISLDDFGAQLVRNTVPFKVTDTPVPKADELRLVTYLYEPGYAAHQVSQGGGFFLERHQFPQFITPLREECSGFVILAKPSDNGWFELVGVNIPFGFTLVIREGCIHGDTAITGLFLMGMTSNHTVMSQATDTVFLRTTNNKNVEVLPTYPLFTPDMRAFPDPLVLYRPFSLAEMTRFVGSVWHANVQMDALSFVGFIGRIFWLLCLWLWDKF